MYQLPSANVSDVLAATEVSARLVPDTAPMEKVTNSHVVDKKTEWTVVEESAHTKDIEAAGEQRSVLYQDAGHDATWASLQRDYRNTPSKSPS